MYVRRAAFVDGLEFFDAGCFRLSAAELAGVPVAQRMLLTVAAAALSRAGYPRGALADRDIGVYVGHAGAPPLHPSSRPFAVGMEGPPERARTPC